MEDFLTLTSHSAFNYGAVLQTYALYTYLTNLGYNGKIIDYHAEYFNRGKTNNKFKKIIRKIIRIPDNLKGRDTFGGFIKNNINLTERVENIEDLKSKLPKSKLYIVGSDQVWNCGKNECGNDDAFFLTFTNGKKISYAASIAMDQIDNKNAKRFQENLKDFFAISVRETTAVKLLGQIGIKDVKQCIDPVFLLEEEQWLNLIKKSRLARKLKNEKYILVYGFLRQKNIYDYAHKLASKKGCKVYTVNTLLEDYFIKKDKYFWNVSPEDFLALIYYANEIVTNSFHGVSFSIIFEKSFHLFDKKGNSNSRMNDLINMIELKNRKVIDEDKLITEKIDFFNTKKILNTFIQNSKDFLNRALEGENK